MKSKKDSKTWSKRQEEIFKKMLDNIYDICKYTHNIELLELANRISKYL